MGRPLNKRFFAKADVGPTVAGNEIQVRFYDGERQLVPRASLLNKGELGNL